jgi:hypothetical protein
VAEHYFAVLMFKVLIQPQTGAGVVRTEAIVALPTPSGSRAGRRRSARSRVRLAPRPSRSLKLGEAEGQSYGVDCLKVELRVAEQCQLDLPAESDDVRLVEEELVGS